MANNTALIAGGVGCALIGLCCVCGGAAYFVSQGAEQSGFPMPGTSPTVQTPNVTADQPVPAPAGYQEVRGDGFAYNVPAAWQEQSNPGVVRMHGSKEHPGRTVNITTEPFVGTPEAYMQASLRGLGQQSQVRITGQRPAQVGSQGGFEIESDWTEGNVRVHLLQLGTARNGKGFVLTCGDLAERFADAQAECRAILASFRVL